MKSFTHGSLFSGIGGFDLASQWMGWENKFHCEWNEFGQKVLKYYWPKAKSYENIKETDFNVWRGKIDILTGGFPCQPYSSAGKRLGKEDDRHLWPEMLRAIREIRPKWVLGENVLGIVNWNGGLVFNEVQADLEAEGYEVQPYVLPAVSVNAPHRRDRVWFVAYSGSNCNTSSRKSEANKRKGRKGIKRTKKGRIRSERLNGLDGFYGTSPNSKGSSSEGKCKCGQGQRKFGGCNCSTTANPNSGRFTGKEYGQTESGQYSEKGVSEWFKDFPTQPPICSGNDGLSDELDGITFPKWRNESIKAYGNAIVPQVALQIFKAIENYSKIN